MLVISGENVVLRIEQNASYAPLVCSGGVFENAQDDENAGIVHDLGNLIQVVSAAINIIGRNPSVMGTSSLLPIVARARVSLESASALVRQTMACARDRSVIDTNAELVNIKATLSPLTDVLASLCDSSIEFQMALQDDLPPVRCSSVDLRTAVLNLVMNARDASTNGGVIAIVVKREALSTKDEVVVSVADRGMGMSEATRARAFEPRFTTKEGERGTGYGLAMVQQFMRASNGSASIRSEFGKGTVVTMRFPAANEANGD
jgi:signal transduction histidine kinase